MTIFVEISHLGLLVLEVNPICTGDFGSFMTRGGADLPPPSKNGGNGWEVQKLSWNLISYQDWCQTWGFTTFRYLEPPQPMVWKSDFFRGSLRFVRAPPYESWANWTNFLVPWKTVIFLGVNSLVPSSSLKMRESQFASNSQRMTQVGATNPHPFFSLPAAPWNGQIYSVYCVFSNIFESPCCISI